MDEWCEPRRVFRRVSCLLESCAHRRMHSDVDTFDLVERDLFGQAIIELRGAGGLVPRDPGGRSEARSGLSLLPASQKATISAIMSGRSSLQNGLPAS